jgi:superoxide dismutase, Fe-Mn family
MNKRDFLKTGLLGFIGIVAIPSIVKGNGSLLKPPKQFKLPPLPYSYDALEPFIDKETLQNHHGKIHQIYTDRLNSVINTEGISVTTARDVLKNSSKYSKSVVSNSCEYFNHRIYWRMLSPNGGGNPSGKLENTLISNFDSIENFKSEFTKAALSVNGSGWVWLINQRGSLKIVTGNNNENPLMETISESKKGFPILCLDVSDHAYRSKNKNDINTYINSFWKILNWNTVNLRFNKSIS